MMLLIWIFKCFSRKSKVCEKSNKIWGRKKLADIYKYSECSLKPLLQGIFLSVLKSLQTRCSCIIEKRVVWERTVRRGLVESSLIRSCFQFPVFSRDPCQGSLLMPGYVPQWSRPDPDSLTWFHSLDLSWSLATPGLLADPYCHHQICCPLLWVLWDWTFVSATNAPSFGHPWLPAPFSLEHPALAAVRQYPQMP